MRLSNLTTPSLPLTQLTILGLSIALSNQAFADDPIETTARGFTVMQSRELNAPAAPARPAEPSAPPKPIELPYKTGDVVAPGFHLETRSIWGLRTAGLILFTASYAPLALLGGATSFCHCKQEVSPMLFVVPIVGPAIFAQSDPHHWDAMVGWAVADGVVQLGGIVMAYMGGSTTVRVQDSAPVSPTLQSVVVAPLGERGQGVFLGGTF